MMYQAAGGHITFLHIKAHSCTPSWNEAADVTAKAAAMGMLFTCQPIFLGDAWFHSPHLADWAWCLFATYEFRAAHGVDSKGAVVLDFETPVPPTHD